VGARPARSKSRRARVTPPPRGCGRAKPCCARGSGPRWNSGLPVGSLRCLVASAVALVTERLSPEHLALPVGWSAGQRASGHFGQFTRGSQIAGDAHGVLHHGEQPHPPLATGADEDIHGEGTPPEVRPRGDVRSYAASSQAPVFSAVGARRERHGLAAASIPA